MKIINFNDFLPFKKIREKLEISEDFKPNFEGSKAILEAMKWEEIKTKGLDISIEELSVADDGTLEHKDYPGQKMIVYIRDYNGGFKNSSLPKFHISWCSTLKSMTESGRYSRYVVSQRDDGIFLLNKSVYGKIVEKNVEADLNVCKNCLKKLNYSDYTGWNTNPQQKEKIVEDFKVREFLEKYNTNIIIEPEHTQSTQPLNEYPKNWDEVSRNYRKSKNWICEDCGINMTSNKRDLHVHHIDGNKFNLKASNLEAVCLSCHKKKPMHRHMANNPMFNR
ncbi:HNH endonuclease [Fusobacteria bacterium ZRK30]|nr:HNH endonuclease [Fusobacteria bacterium ZRK30]